MTFDSTTLFLSMIPSGIGFVLSVYGRKQQRWPHLAAGIALMVYPYFTSGATSMLVVGAAICGALWLAVRLGY